MTVPPARIHLDETDSTNGYLLARGAELPHLSSVSAERQSAGRGRHGRRWESVPGNHHFSLLVRTPLPAADLPLLNLLAALALRGALSALAPGFAIKWPNDILRGGRKVAGVLVETVVEADRLVFAVLGFGVNARRVPDGIRDARTEPGDLADCPACRDREALIAGTLTTLVRYLSGGRILAADLARDFSAALDPAARVRFLLPDGAELAARVAGVTEAGGPLIIDGAAPPRPLPDGATFL